MADDDRTPTANITPFGLRMQPDLKARIEEAARASGRSLNSEIVTRLGQFDGIKGETNLFYEIARSLAIELDNLDIADGQSNSPQPKSLIEKILEDMAAIDHTGKIDRERISREYTAEARRILDGTFRLPADLKERIEDKSFKNSRSLRGEILSTLEREYPAPQDVMHIHLDDIRHALDLYEKETDPRKRMQLQTLVEHLATSGYGMEIDWETEDL